MKRHLSAPVAEKGKGALALADPANVSIQKCHATLTHVAAAGTVTIDMA